jgi:hypothetical protein
MEGVSEGAITVGQGTAAYVDGIVDVVPFIEFHPLERMGAYDSGRHGLGMSQAVGSVSRDVALFFAGGYAWTKVPVLGGPQLSSSTGLGLSFMGLSPTGVASAESSLSLLSSFVLTNAFRYSTFEQLMKEVKNAK